MQLTRNFLDGFGGFRSDCHPVKPFVLLEYLRLDLILLELLEIFSLQLALLEHLR